MDTVERSKISRKVHRVSLQKFEVSGISILRSACDEWCADMPLILAVISDRFPQSDLLGGIYKGMGEVDSDHFIAGSPHLERRSSDSTP